MTYKIFLQRKILLLILFLFSTLFASGGYDHGTAAGKGNIDLSLTWNPFNYFKQGQSYLIIGYGLTNRCRATIGPGIICIFSF